MWTFLEIRVLTFSFPRSLIEDIFKLFPGLMLHHIINWHDFSFITGCYQRFPLYICLSGVDEYSERPVARNLYLSRLLIERGANVNHRVPVVRIISAFLTKKETYLVAYHCGS